MRCAQYELDTVGHRLSIAHQDRGIVVDPDSGRVLGEIAGLNRAHGVAFAYEAGHGFATSGADSTVTMFDLKSLRVLGHTMVPPDDDAVLYDPATKRIFTFNGDAHSATALDAVSGKRLGDIEQPEMDTVFNLGIGFVMIVGSYYAESIQRQLQEMRIPTHVIGEVNGGWGVAMTLLGYERGEAAAVTPIMYRTELDRLTALARERGKADDLRRATERGSAE